MPSAGPPPAPLLAIFLCALGPGCATHSRTVETASAPQVTSTAAAPPATWDLEVYATTDIHGHLEPQHLVSRPGEPAIERGGLAWLAGYLNNARRAHGDRVLLLDGGDMMQGTLASNVGEGAPMIRALSAMGYAAAALGNHEFDYGPIGPAPSPSAPSDDPRGALKARIAEASFPILAANLRLAGQPPLTRPWTMARVHGVMVGVVGATTANLRAVTNPANLGGIEVLPIAESIAEAAVEAEKAGARVVIATMHAGGECRPAPARRTERQPGTIEGCLQDSEVFEVARVLARRTEQGLPGRIRAIVAGHTHQPLTAVVGGIPIVQAGKNGHYLGHIALEVSGQGGEAAPTGRFVVEPPIPICAAVDARGACASTHAAGPHQPPSYLGPVVEDAAMNALMSADLERARQIAARPLGVKLEAGLRTAYHAEAPLGNLVADAVREAMSADAGVVNGGGLRSDLPPGDLVFGALYEALPFDNRAVVVELSAAQLEGLLRRNVSANNGIVSLSGVRLRARCEGAALKTSLLDAKGRAVSPDRRLRVATLDFLVAGGDGLLPEGIRASAPGPILRDTVEAALVRRKRIGANDVAVYDAAHRRYDTPAHPLSCDHGDGEAGSAATH